MDGGWLGPTEAPASDSASGPRAPSRAWRHKATANSELIPQTAELTEGDVLVDSAAAPRIRTPPAVPPATPF